MVDQIAVATFTTRATVGTQDITDPSITEAFSCAIFLWGEASDDTDNTHANAGIGFCADDAGAATQEHACGPAAEDGLNTVPDTHTAHSTSNCIHIPNATNGAAAALVTAQFSAAIAGGVRLNFSTTTVQARVTAILFAGLSRAYVDGATGSTVGASEAVGGTTDFRPKCVVFAASDANLNTAQSDCAPNIGFAIDDASVSQVCAYLNMATSNEPTDADGFLRSDDAFAHTSQAKPRTGTLVPEWSHVDQFTATGFDHTSNLGTPDAHYLGMLFSGNVRVACAHLSVDATTGEQSFNAFGFTPDIVIGMASLLTTLDTETDGAGAAAWAYFVTGRYGTRAYTGHHQEGLTLAGATVSSAHTRHEDAFVLYDHTGAVAQRATWVGGSGSGGFKLNFSVASTAGMLTAIGIQTVPSPPLPVRRPSRQRKESRVAHRRTPIIQSKAAAGFVPSGLSRLLSQVARFRRAAKARLRRVFAPPGMVPPTPTVLEEPPRDVSPLQAF